MALQDDIFDTAAALKGTREAVFFERVCIRLGRLEAENEDMHKTLATLRAGAIALKHLMRG